MKVRCAKRTQKVQLQDFLYCPPKRPVNLVHGCGSAKFGLCCGVGRQGLDLSKEVPHLDGALRVLQESITIQTVTLEDRTIQTVTLEERAVSAYSLFNSPFDELVKQAGSKDSSSGVIRRFCVSKWATKRGKMGVLSLMLTKILNDKLNELDSLGLIGAVFSEETGQLEGKTLEEA